MSKQKLKLLYYGATDHRHKYTMLGLMVPFVVAGVVAVSWQSLLEQPRILFTIFVTVGVMAGLAAFYCFIGQVLFDRQVKKQQGGKTVHDMG